jgi:hypothetical protein
MDKNRIGFAPASCTYADFHEDRPGAGAGAGGGRDDDQAEGVCGEMQARSECTAACDVKASSKSNYYAEGIQVWETDSDCDRVTKETRSCHMACSANNYEIVVPENIKCATEPWSECSSKCIQTQKVYQWKNKKCQVSKTISRNCYASQCPTQSGRVWW